MRMLDEITLRKKTEKSRVGGVPEYTNADTVVFADVKSVVRSEWYAANMAGIKADIVFVVNPDDFTDQTEVVYGTKTYSIIRAYQNGPRRVELTCKAVS